MNCYALQTAPLKERLVVRQLRACGIDEFWPHYLAGVRHGKRRGYAFRSWISPYIFVMDGPKFDAGVVNNLMGVSTLLYCGEKLLKVPEDVIFDLKSMAEPDGLIPGAIAKLRPKNMVMISGANLISCLDELRKLKTKVWAKGMLSTERDVRRRTAA